MIIDNLFVISEDNELLQYLGNDKSITFPKEIKKIGKGVFNNANYLEEAKIPESIIDIGESAFANCVNLKKVIFANGTKVIGKRAFYNCTSLRFISLPSNLEIIDEEAFYNCASLTKEGIEVIIANTIGVRAFSHCSSLRAVSLSRVETIKEEAFANCVALQYMIIPPWVEHLEKHIFYNCPKLGNIYFDYNKEYYDQHLKDGNFSNDIVEKEKRRCISCKTYYKDPQTIIVPSISILGNNDLIKQSIKRIDFITYHKYEEKGFETLVSNAFKDINIKDNKVDATYVGTELNPYIVKLSIDDKGNIISSCTCPSFSKWGSRDNDCKHTYALKYLLRDYYDGHKIIYPSVSDLRTLMHHKRDVIRQAKNRELYQELLLEERVNATDKNTAMSLFERIKDYPPNRCFYFDNFINFQEWLIKTFDREGYTVSQFHSAKTFKDLIIRLLKSKHTTCYVMRRFKDISRLEDISYDHKNEIPKYDSFDHVPYWEGEYYRFTKISSLRDIDLDNRRLLSAYDMTNLIIYNDEGEMWIMTSSLY